MSPEQKKEIIDVLVNRIPNISCPMCHGKSFTIAEGYVVNQLQDDFKSLVISGEKLIPSVYMICTNCGFVSQHALGVLDLLKKEDKDS